MNSILSEPELQPLQRVQAKPIRREPRLLIFNAGLNGPAVTERLDEPVHGTSSWLLTA